MKKALQDLECFFSAPTFLIAGNLGAGGEIEKWPLRR